MRALFMASAALMMSTGFAMAQTSTSAPAPTGAPNSAVGTPSGSPGNMAPNKSTMSPSASAQPSNTGTASSAPAPTGAPNAAAVSPGASPGNMAPAKSASSPMGQNADTGQTPGTPAVSQTASNSVPPSTPVHHHHAMGYGMASLPANASARTYLHIAKVAIRDHEMARADDALSHAETRLLTRSVPADSGSLADDSPAVTAIEHARSALGAGNYAEAYSDTETATQQVHGDAGGASNASDMSTP